MAWDQDDLEQIMNREITTFRGWKIYLLSYLLSFTNSWQVSTTEHGACYYGLVTVYPPMRDTPPHREQRPFLYTTSVWVL